MELSIFGGFETYFQVEAPFVMSLPASDAPIVEVAPGFYNIRGTFSIVFGVIDIGIEVIYRHWPERNPHVPHQIEQWKILGHWYSSIWARAQICFWSGSNDDEDEPRNHFLFLWVEKMEDVMWCESNICSHIAADK